MDINKNLSRKYQATTYLYSWNSWNNCKNNHYVSWGAPK